MHFPDIKNGSLLNGFDGYNRWLTEIQCIVEIGDKTGYLAHECRAERIPHSTKAVGNCNHIFERSGESMVFLYDNQTYKFPVQPRLGRPSPAPFGRFDRPSKALINSSAVTVFSPSEILELLRTNPPSARDIFICAEFEGIKIYAPCRYINFAHKDHPKIGSNSDSYIQPISGYIVFPDGDDFRIGYMACCIQEGKEPIIGVTLRRMVNPFDIMVKNKQRSGKNAFLYKLASIIPICIPDFSDFRHFNGEVKLYTYA